MSSCTKLLMCRRLVICPPPSLKTTAFTLFTLLDPWLPELVEHCFPQNILAVSRFHGTRNRNLLIRTIMFKKPEIRASCERKRCPPILEIRKAGTRACSSRLQPSPWFGQESFAITLYVGLCHIDLHSWKR